MLLETNKQTFLELARAGLWADVEPADLEVQGLTEAVDWEKVYQLAEEQSVVGLVLAGIERLKNSNANIKLNQELLLQWIGEVQIIEQQNLAMNWFVAKLIEKLRKEDVYAVLVKGQGVAQCYGKPLWRASGDIDLLLSDSNHRKAISYLTPLSSSHKNGGNYSKEYALTIDDWMIELHGTLRTGLSGRVDQMVDEVQRDVFYSGNVRSWDNNGTMIFLPSPDNDVFFVFTHFIKHFYKEGMNLRQVCDWCRLIWMFRSDLDLRILETRIRKAGLMEEWKAFAALAVDYLGMPADAMPMYNSISRWSEKAKLLVEQILKGTTGRVVSDTWSIAKIFHWHAFKFSPAIFFNVSGLKIKERVFGRLSSMLLCF